MSPLLGCVCVLVVCAGGARHHFYRGEEVTSHAGGTRRVLGGRVATRGEAALVCALLDRYWRTRCSCSPLGARWALTAAHCVSPHVTYVRCGAARGDPATVHYLYRHPGYRVIQQDEGRGPDVTLLHNDVGLVRTRQELRAPAEAAPASLAALLAYDATALSDCDVLVLGYGRTERGDTGGGARAVLLRTAPCERAEWRRCACGGAPRGEPARGVCVGDSGGPVLYRGVQVAVTSMGPVECASVASVPEGATSVFTALYHYVDLINATMCDTEAALRMRLISAAGPRRRHRDTLALCALAHTLRALV